MTNSKIRHVSDDINERKFREASSACESLRGHLVPNNELENGNAITTRLQLLLRIAGAVDNPSFAVSFYEFADLLAQLAQLLQNLEVGKDQLNDEVFEDPLHRADSLGNVKMVHKKMHAADADLLRRLGKELAVLCHNAIATYRQKTQSYYVWSEMDLDCDDDCRTEDILEAKRLVRTLRRENSRLDRRNESLYLENDRLRAELAKHANPARGWNEKPFGWVPHTFGVGYSELEPVGIYRDAYPDLPSSPSERIPFSKEEIKKGLHKGWISRSRSQRLTRLTELLKDDDPVTANPEHFTCTEEDGKPINMPRKHSDGKQSESSQIEFSFGE